MKFLEGVMDFLDGLDTKTREKILFNIDKANVKSDSVLFKKLNSDIWEFRTLFNKKPYRLFSFWDKTDNRVTIVVATPGIVKKTQKTPIKDIEKATEIMKKYFEDKNRRK